MKNMQKIGQLALLLLVLSGIISCDNNNNEEPFAVVGDVMIIKRMINEQDHFVRSYYAYGNQPMSEAEVTLPEGGTLELVADEANNRTFMKKPSIGDFSTEIPEIGTFDFTVVNEGIGHSVSEELTFNDLPYATITSADYSGGTIMVNWELAEGAANYVVRLVDENYDPIFTGQLLPSTQAVYQISSNGGVWTQTPESGKTYQVEVRAISYDDEATDNNFYYNVNVISVATQDVVWGD